MRRPARLTARGTSVGVAALVAVDVALITLAVQYTAPAPLAAIAPGATTSGAMTGPPSTAPYLPLAGTTTATPTTTPGPRAINVQPAPLRVGLVALSGTVAWRTSGGSCETGGGAVSVTSDGGKTWTRRALPDQAMMRVLPTSGNGARIVSAGRDCQPAVRTTADGGATWTQAAGVGTTWFRDPKDTQVVHAPGPLTVRPCDAATVVDLAPLTASRAHVLCGDGSVRASRDSGSTWTPVGAAPGALALDSRLEKGSGTAYVLRVADGCAGLQVARVGPSAAQVLGCVDEPGGPVDPGTIALSINGSDGWVEVGDRVWRSQDDLRTWAPA